MDFFDRDLPAGTAARFPASAAPGRFEAPRIAPFALLGRFFNLLMVWDARFRERQHVAYLSDRDLRDMGLRRADVEREAAKPFWQP